MLFQGRWHNLIITASALLVSLVALLVIYGWIVHDPSLVQIKISSVPMQFNTALCFLLCSVSLLTLDMRRRYISVSAAALAGLLAALTLLQYLFVMNLGVDTLFIQPFTQVHTSNPGRMAPNTAIAFILTSAALLLCAARSGVGHHFLVTALLGGLVVALGTAPLLGYFYSVEGAYGWGKFTHMAIHTAGCFVLMGIGIISYAWKKSEKLPLWLPLPICISLITITISMTVAMYGSEIRKSDTMSSAIENLPNWNATFPFAWLITGLLMSLLTTLSLFLALKWRYSTQVLYESDALKSAILSSTHYMVIAADVNGTITIFNKAAEQALGYTAAEVVGRKTPVIWHDPEEVTKRAEVLSAELGFPVASGFDVFVKKADTYGVDENEWTFIRKDGSRFPVNLAVTALRDKQQKITGYMGVIEDITASKEIDIVRQAERALRENERRLNFVMENTGVGTWELNLRNNSAYRSLSHDLIFGYKEMQPKWTYEIFLEHVAPDDRSMVDKRFRSAIKAKGNWNFECCIRRVDGERRWIWAKGRHHFDTTGTIPMMSGIIQDITDRREADKIRKMAVELSDARMFLKKIIDHVPDPIFVKDDQHRLIQGNKAMWELFGRPEKEILGKNDYDFFPKEEADVFWKKDREVFESREANINIENFTDASGCVHTISTKKACFTGLQGRQILVGTIRDISDIKEANDTRQKLVEKLTISNTALEQFAYAASHDMQEPLRMIRNFSGLIANEYGGRLDQEGQLYLNMVIDASIRMQAIVEDLLEYATKELEHALENLFPSIQERGARITYDPLPVLKANPVQFIRLLQNIISNGLKYQPSNAMPQIHIGVEDKDGHWCFSVRDNGIGISKEYLTQVFEPFKRLHSWGQYKGTGLGLALCKKIVETHGGKIWVTSEPGKGSIFYFTMLKQKMENL